MNEMDAAVSGSTDPRRNIAPFVNRIEIDYGVFDLKYGENELGVSFCDGTNV